MLKKLCKDRTIFVIAHRLLIVINANNIMVIKNSMILKQGFLDEFIKVKNKYYGL